MVRWGKRMAQTRAIVRPIKTWLIILIVAGLLFGAWSYAKYVKEWREDQLMSELSDIQRLLVEEMNKAGGDIALATQQYQLDYTKQQLRIAVANLSLKLAMANRELAEKMAENSILKSKVKDFNILYTGSNRPQKPSSYEVADILQIFKDIKSSISKISVALKKKPSQFHSLQAEISNISILERNLNQAAKRLETTKEHDFRFNSDALISSSESTDLTSRVE